MLWLHLAWKHDKNERHTSEIINESKPSGIIVLLRPILFIEFILLGLILFTHKQAPGVNTV